MPPNYRRQIAARLEKAWGTPALLMSVAQMGQVLEVLFPEDYSVEEDLAERLADLRATNEPAANDGV